MTAMAGAGEPGQRALRHALWSASGPGGRCAADRCRRSRGPGRRSTPCWKDYEEGAHSPANTLLSGPTTERDHAPATLHYARAQRLAGGPLFDSVDLRIIVPRRRREECCVRFLSGKEAVSIRRWSTCAAIRCRWYPAARRRRDAASHRGSWQASTHDQAGAGRRCRNAKRTVRLSGPQGGGHRGCDRSLPRGPYRTRFTRLPKSLCVHVSPRYRAGSMSRTSKCLRPRSQARLVRAH